jgi:hypothetical protein
MENGTCVPGTNGALELARSRPQPEIAAFLVQARRLLVSVKLFHELGFGTAAVPDPEPANRIAVL